MKVAGSSVREGGKLWMDNDLRHFGDRPWRKVHAGILAGPNSPSVGNDFDAKVFAETLRNAHVDSVVVAAKNIWGYCFYPSELGPVHPGLGGLDLFGAEVEACKSVGIKVYGYFSYTWDEYAAARHPEWLVWKRDRTTYLNQFDEQPFWSALCIAHPELVDDAIDHTTEILSTYPVDGMWYDEVYPVGGECFCWRCLNDLKSSGKDPFDRASQLEHKQALRTDVVRRLGEHVQKLRPDAQVEVNTQAVLGFRDYRPYVNSIDIEALPTGGWGYHYLPLHGRYARTFGLPVYGMTGKFHNEWGDQGGLKHPVQLRTEIAGTLALGLRCDIGDGRSAGGGLDPTTYAVIGEVYEEVERLEPYLEGAVPVSEAAVLVDGPPLARFAPVGPTGQRIETAHASSLGGVAKLLTELHVQFDIVDVHTDLDRYQLIVLPDSLEVNRALAQRLIDFMGRGGKVIASQLAARIAGEDELWPPALAGGFRGTSPFDQPFSTFTSDLFEDSWRFGEYQFALYSGSDRWQPPVEAAAILGRLTEPEPESSEKGWLSAPASRQTEFATVVVDGNFGGFSFPIGSSYFDHGYWIYRDVFEGVLNQLLPRPVVRSNAPKSADVTLTHQAATAERGARWLVHLVNYSPLRRSRNIEYLEDPIPLRDVEIALAIDGEIAKVTEARTDTPLEFARNQDRWVATIPNTSVASLVVFEEARA